MNVDLAGCQCGVDADGPAREDEAAGDLPVRRLQIAGQAASVERCNECVGELMMVQDSATAGRTSYDIDTVSPAERDVCRFPRLMPPHRETGRTPSIEPERRPGLTTMNRLDDR